MDAEDFRDYRTEQKKRRANRLPIRTEEIMNLETKGYTVEKKSDYHFRINNQLDLFPIHNRFHNIKTNKRGGYRDIEILLTSELNLKI